MDLPTLIAKWEKNADGEEEPKKLGEQFLAVREIVAAPGKVFTVAGVAAAFKGAKKKDVEGILDGFASLGVLTGFETPEGRRWRAAGKG